MDSLDGENIINAKLRVNMIIIMTECSYTLQRYTMIQKSFIEIQRQQNCYTCGCGQIFQKVHLFKDHLLLFHSTYSFHGSSHFIAKFTEIVLPIAKEQFNVFQQCNTIKTKKIKNQNEKQMVNHIETKSRKQKTRGRAKFQVKAIKEAQNFEEVPQELQESQQNEQNERDHWNGFKLVRNKQSSEDSFYCGKCNTSFTKMPEFIVHCIQSCQQLRCSLSSHFIECFIESKTKIAKYERTISIMTRLKRGESFQELDMSLEQYFLELSKRKLDHGHQEFYCYYCNKILNGSGIYMRHRTVHEDLIHQLSSHIIIRIKPIAPEYKLSRTNIYISASYPWLNQSSNYYCPCNIESKMNMPKLIQHIKTVHMGISPYYICPDD